MLVAYTSSAFQTQRFVREWIIQFLNVVSMRSSLYCGDIRARASEAAVARIFELQIFAAGCNANTLASKQNVFAPGFQ
jgi:hypothetical protein